jgi:YD repeat-containing protein
MVRPTTYIYDCVNRLTALGAGGATTTYSYDENEKRTRVGNST